MPVSAWPRARSLVTVRSPETWTLACLYVGGAFGSLLGALAPFSPDAPVPLSYACCVLAVIVAVLVWLFGDRLGWLVHNAAVLLGITLISVLIANVATAEGASVTAFAYLWVAVYAGHFFSRRQAWAHAALISVGYAVALLVNDLPDARKTYVVVVGTVWGAVTVLGNVVSRMRQQADTDQLTGLLNRAGFRTAAEREHALATRTGLPLAMVVLDLDGFKAINDRSGHAAGDRTLADLAVRWKAVLRSCDILGRHGGDEFVLLLPATTPDQAEVVLDRLRASSPLAWSAGIATWERGEVLDDCLGRADQDLYRAKGLRPAALGR
jgi:diguanylate cyclase (GGDEF)-like protein